MPAHSPPLQKILQVVEGNLLVQFVAFTSAIDVTEATYVFPSCNRDDPLELEMENEKITLVTTWTQSSLC